jgi:hypothetical protein
VQSAVPERNAELASILKTFQSKHDELDAVIRKALVPVQHTIRIEAAN